MTKFVYSAHFLRQQQLMLDVVFETETRNNLNSLKRNICLGHLNHTVIYTGGIQWRLWISFC